MKLNHKGAKNKLERLSFSDFQSDPSASTITVNDVGMRLCRFFQWIDSIEQRLEKAGLETVL